MSSARRSFAFISGSASFSNSKRAVIEIKGALLLLGREVSPLAAHILSARGLAQGVVQGFDVVGPQFLHLPDIGDDEVLDKRQIGRAGLGCPLMLAALLGQPVHQELYYRHGGPRPSTAMPIRASFCRRTGACRSLSQPLFRVSWNQGVTHWTLQAKSCAKGVLLLAYRLGQVLQNALHFEVATGDPHPFGNPSK